MQNQTDGYCWTPFMKALFLNLLILALWYLLEYAQFGRLQWGRVGDDAAGICYFLATYVLFCKCDYYRTRADRKR